MVLFAGNCVIHIWARHRRLRVDALYKSTYTLLYFTSEITKKRNKQHQQPNIIIIIYTIEREVPVHKLNKVHSQRHNCSPIKIESIITCYRIETFDYTYRYLH